MGNGEEAWAGKGPVGRQDFGGRDLRGVDLSGADLRGAALSGVDLRDVDLRDVDLQGVDLRGVDLRGAELSGCDLRRAALMGVDLRGARLDSAVLCGADLTGALLDGARLLGADLRAAVLDGTRWRRAALVGARFDEGALDGRDTFGAAMPDSASTAEPQTSPGRAADWGLEFSPDGALLASCGAAGGVWLWEAGSWQLLRRLDGHAGWVYAIAFSPDTTLLASGGDDGTLWVWDLGSGHGREIVGGLSFVRSVAFSPDGAYLMSTGDDGVVRAWAAASGWLMTHELTGDGARMFSMAFNRDGTLLAVGGDCVVRLYSVASWRLEHEFASDLHWGVKVSFDAAGRLVAAGRHRDGLEDACLTWSIRTRRQVQRSERRVDFEDQDLHVSVSSPDRRVRVSTSTESGTIAIFSGGEPTWLRRVDVSVRSVALDAAGTVLAGCAWTKSARPGAWLWRTDAVRDGVWPAPRPLEDPGEELRSVVVDPAGTMVAACGYGNNVLVWETGSGRLLTRLTDDAWVHSAAFSPDGSVLAAYGRSGVRRWETQRWEPLAPFSPRDPATGRGVDWLAWPVVRFSPAGTVLAAGGDNNGLVVWRGEERSYLRAPGIGVDKCPVAFGADGTLVAVGVSGAILLWDLTTGLVRHRIEGYRRTVTAVGFDADTTMVVGAGADRVVRVWDVATGRLVRSLPGHTDIVLDVVFGPGGTLVSAGWDGVRVWNLQTGSCRAHLISGIDGAAWEAIGLCRFEPGELDRFRPDGPTPPQQQR